MFHTHCNRRRRRRRRLTLALDATLARQAANFVGIDLRRFVVMKLDTAVAWSTQRTCPQLSYMNEPAVVNDSRDDGRVGCLAAAGFGRSAVLAVASAASSSSMSESDVAL